MPKIKEVTVSSKMTVKFGDNYSSFESSYTADVSDLETEAEVNSYTLKLYDKVNNIIDTEVDELIEMYNKKIAKRRD